MAALYSNENFPLQVVEALRALGHDVLTSLEAGQANQSIPDGQVLAYATAQGRALLTLNRRDFIRLHQDNPAHAGLIVCTQDPDAIGQAERIDRAIQGQAHLAGQLLRVNRPTRSQPFLHPTLVQIVGEADETLYDWLYAEKRPRVLQAIARAWRSAAD